MQQSITAILGLAASLVVASPVPQEVNSVQARNENHVYWDSACCTKAQCWNPVQHPDWEQRKVSSGYEVYTYQKCSANTQNGFATEFTCESYNNNYSYNNVYTINNVYVGDSVYYHNDQEINWEDANCVGDYCWNPYEHPTWEDEHSRAGYTVNKFKNCSGNTQSGLVQALTCNSFNNNFSNNNVNILNDVNIL